MTVPPQHHLLKQEETQHAEQDGTGNDMHVPHTRRVQCMRQHRQERRTEQRADGVTDQRRQHARPQLLRQQQKYRGRQHAEHTAEQGKQENPG